MPQRFTAKVISKEKVSSKVYLVIFQLIDPPEIEFNAGQNIMLMIAPEVNRVMSIASPPNLKNQILMVHDVSPMGPGSIWTLNLAVGDQMEFMAPTGGALALIDSPRKKVFVATGTGIAPFRSMIIDCLSRYELLTMNYELILYWGLRLEEDIYWKEEFENLEKQYPNFHFYLVLSKASDHWQGKTGHVTEHVLNEEKDLENSDFYLCGNKEMVKELEEQLLAKNVPKERIKTELFY